MAELLNKIPTNLTEYPNSFKRQGAFPLEAYSIFYATETQTALEVAKDYAANNPIAYVGQTIAVVEGSTVTLYIIESTAGDIKAVGSAPVGDESTITVAADGTVSLLGVEGLIWKDSEDNTVTTYQPLLSKDAEGKVKLTWVVPSTTTVEGLATELNSLKQKLVVDENLIASNTSAITELKSQVGTEATEGAAATGLFKDVADVESRVETIENDYLKSADKTELANSINALATTVSVEAAEVDSLSLKVTDIESAYKTADEDLAKRITALEGTTHFTGVGSIADRDAIESPEAGDVYIVNTGDNSGKEYIYNGTEWVELGDVTAENERIEAVEGRVTSLEGSITTLEAALDEKVGADHSHEITDVTGLEEALAGKQATGDYATKAEAQAIADGKDAAILAAKNAADAAQVAVDAVPGLIATAKSEAISEAETKAKELDEALKTELSADITKNATDITSLTSTVESNKTAATQQVSEAKAELTNSISLVDEKVTKNTTDIASIAALVGQEAGDTEAAGLFADIEALQIGLATKVDNSVATQNNGIRFINQDEISKLSKLALEGDSVVVSGTINADNVQGIENKIIDVVTGSGAIDDTLNKLEIQAGAQANKIETVKVNGQALTVVDKAVDISLTTLGIISSDAVNKVTHTSDGTLEVTSLNVNKLVQTEGEELILWGGDANT